MDKASLVESKIQAGRRLLETLDDQGFGIRTAFWNYTDEAGWRLVLASRLVRERGPHEAYRQLAEALAQMPADFDLAISEISLVRDTDMFIDRLAKAVSTGEGAPSRIRFTENTVSGVFVQDALIYRST